MVVQLRPQTLSSIPLFQWERQLAPRSSTLLIRIESFIEGSEGSLANLHTSYVPVLSWFSIGYGSSTICRYPLFLTPVEFRKHTTTPSQKISHFFLISHLNQSIKASDRSCKGKSLTWIRSVNYLHSLSFALLAWIALCAKLVPFGFVDSTTS